MRETAYFKLVLLNNYSNVFLYVEMQFYLKWMILTFVKCSMHILYQRFVKPDWYTGISIFKQKFAQYRAILFNHTQNHDTAETIWAVI